MPNVNPNTSTIENLEKKFEMASTKSVGNYSFYLGATNDNIEEIKKHDPKIMRLESFYGSIHCDLLVDKYESLKRFLNTAQQILLLTVKIQKD